MVKDVYQTEMKAQKRYQTQSKRIWKVISYQDYDNMELHSPILPITVLALEAVGPAKALAREAIGIHPAEGDKSEPEGNHTRPKQKDHVHNQRQQQQVGRQVKIVGEVLVKNRDRHHLPRTILRTNQTNIYKQKPMNTPIMSIVI
jgi:hypothetical protein